MAALLRSAPWLYEAVRYGGAVYLAWVGIQIFFVRRCLRCLALPPRVPTRMLRRASSHARCGPLFVKGLLTNLLNPKALLFCSVLLPQFVRPEAGPVALQMVELGLVLLAIGACFRRAVRDRRRADPAGAYPRRRRSRTARRNRRDWRAAPDEFYSSARPPYPASGRTNCGAAPSITATLSVRKLVRQALTKRPQRA
ncbi:LysE family translocator [Paraburkholderia dipogonis]|uniref:LysE family translocator n=1 Tax=Paraburkholderia dipogonis TaxID=1211383 RepID=UPI0035EA7672